MRELLLDRAALDDVVGGAPRPVPPGRRIHAVAWVRVVPVRPLAPLALRAGVVGQHLVSRHRDRPDLLQVAGVLADQLRVERGLVEDFIDPLVDGGGAVADDQRVAPRGRQRAERDDGLAGAAGQDDHAAAAPAAPGRPEDVDRLALVGAQTELAAEARAVAQGDLQRRAGDVARQVLGRVAELDQRVLEVAAHARLHLQRALVEVAQDEGRELARVADLGDQ